LAYFPVPESATVCGLPLALSAIVIDPASDPLDFGLKLTLIRQFFPAFSELPQVLVSEKLPLAAMLMPVSVALPLLVRVTALVPLVVPTRWFPKLKLVGERLTAGAVDEEVPVPVKVMTWGLPPALSVMVMEPLRVPVVVGVKVTLMLQAALIPSELGQELAAKSPAVTML
jgi:hypothetical protein